ncbi:hypothetical protein HDU97_001099 [Phlyctochytrium planicorne]|nr:hypothetical protein HDU97_001099 [Phlyctochytrium planicorne]
MADSPERGIMVPNTSAALATATAATATATATTLNNGTGINDVRFQKLEQDVAFLTQVLTQLVVQNMASPAPKDQPSSTATTTTSTISPAPTLQLGGLNKMLTLPQPHPHPLQLQQQQQQQQLQQHHQQSNFNGFTLPQQQQQAPSTSTPSSSSIATATPTPAALSLHLDNMQRHISKGSSPSGASQSTLNVADPSTSSAFTFMTPSPSVALEMITSPPSANNNNSNSSSNMMMEGSGGDLFRITMAPGIMSNAAVDSGAEDDSSKMYESMSSQDTFMDTLTTSFDTSAASPWPTAPPSFRFGPTSVPSHIPTTKTKPNPSASPSSTNTDILSHRHEKSTTPTPQNIYPNFPPQFQSYFQGLMSFLQDPRLKVIEDTLKSTGQLDTPTLSPMLVINSRYRLGDRAKHPSASHNYLHFNLINGGFKSEESELEAEWKVQQKMESDVDGSEGAREFRVYRVNWSDRGCERVEGIKELSDVKVDLGRVSLKDPEAKAGMFVSYYFQSLEDVDGTLKPTASGMSIIFDILNRADKKRFPKVEKGAVVNVGGGAGRAGVHNKKRKIELVVHSETHSPQPQSQSEIMMALDIPSTDLYDFTSLLSPPPASTNSALPSTTTNPAPPAPTTADFQHLPALHLASHQNNHASLLHLLSTGSNPNEKSGKHQWTPLHFACLHSATLDIISALIAHGADVNAPDARGLRPLHICTQFGHIASMSLLISSGANVNARDDRTWTPLFLAAQVGNVGTVRCLLESGADVDAKDLMHVSPIMLAFAERKMDACEVLSGAGAVDAPIVEYMMKGEEGGRLKEKEEMRKMKGWVSGFGGLFKKK